MKRWHEEIHIAKRQLKKRQKDHIESNKNRSGRDKVGIDPNIIECKFNELGRYRKRDAYDCGNPHCLLCHSDKFPKREPTRQELKFDIKLQDYSISEAS